MKTTVVNVRYEKCDVYIGRMLKNIEEHFGNPFELCKDGSRKEVIRKFDTWIRGKGYKHIEPKRRIWILDNLELLRDKRIGCHCEPLECHGRVYIALLKFSRHKIKKMMRR